MKFIHPLFVISLLFIFSCSQPSEKESESSENTEESEINSDVESQTGSQEKGKLTLYPANLDQQFPDAQLAMKSPTSTNLNEGVQRFEFEVSNYELAVQTAMNSEKHCANSEKGQHIHFILNNAPYRAEYEPQFDAELTTGNNVVLAFLSRSYHASIKNGKAFVFKNFFIGDNQFKFDEKAAHLFYSRPKGTYEGKDTERILVDFFLINTALSENGNKVRLTINEEVFLISNWEAYFVEGLAKGKHTFRIELLNSEGELIEGPFNDSGLREIELK